MSRTRQGGNPWIDVASYTTQDAPRFKGRDEDVGKFLKIVGAGTMSVLYADSGIGKTSFVNAGVIPALQPEGYFPLHILLPDDVYEREIDLEQWLVGLFRSLCRWQPVIGQSVAGCEHSLWWLLHTHQVSDGGRLLRPLIVFDQFEEVFVKSRRNFRYRLCDQLFQIVESLGSRAVPADVEAVMEQMAARGVFVDIDTDHGYKILFSLRKEYLSDFDDWTNDRYSVPELHQNRMLLRPLTRQQAGQVITRQPDGAGGYVDTLNARKDEIINKIDEAGRDEVDPFILSLLCSRLYDEAAGAGSTGTLDGLQLETVISNFYHEKMAAIVPDGSHAAVIEDALVDPDGNRRRPEVDDEKLKAIGFDSRYRQALEDAHLVRTDTYNGVKTYVEISHDMLARAVSQRRQEQARRQDVDRATRRLRLRQNVLTAVIAALLAGVGLLGWHLKRSADEAERQAREQRAHNFYHTYTVELSADADIPGNYDWQATVRVCQLDGDTLLPLRNAANPFVLGTSKALRMDFQLHDSIVGRNSRVRVVIEPTDPLKLCLAQTDTFALSPDSTRQTLAATIHRNYDSPIILAGRVVTAAGRGLLPVNRAFVALDDQVVRTDSDGVFRIALKDLAANTDGCLTVFKRDYQYMQYELAILLAQAGPGDTLTVELPLSGHLPMDALFEQKRRAADSLYTVAALPANRDSAVTAAEAGWLEHIGVLGTEKRRLRRHQIYASRWLPGCQMLSRADDERNDSRDTFRPVFGWYEQAKTPYLFYGTMARIGDDEWRLRLTVFDKQRFHTDELSFKARKTNGNFTLISKEQ